jgi:ABC-type molybdate transport system substrate-binding protein
VTDHQHASEAARKSSGVVPVLFSASAEAHDDAVIAGEHDTAWRSPFATEGLRPASGE